MVEGAQSNMGKMKIYFITIHVGFNFGSVLQAYATSRKLTELCQGEVKLINYIPDRVTYRRQINRGFRSLKAMLRFPVSLLNFAINDKLLYSRFINKYIPITKACYSINDIQSVMSDASVFVVGSDQVWNTKHNEGIDEAYYGEYVAKKVLKFALSSSIGRNDISEKEKKYLSEILPSFEKISMREKKGIEILESVGYNRAIHLLDPTFLLNKNDWSEIMSRRLVHEPYLLIYIPYNIVSFDSIQNFADNIAKKDSLKTVIFSWNFLSIRGFDKTIKYASPKDFLSLMYHADYVITNSFHGTAFSINFNKQFSVFAPSDFGVRLYDVLDRFGLRNRIVGTESENMPPIDYKNINEILNRERESAESYIKSFECLLT